MMKIRSKTIVLVLIPVMIIFGAAYVYWVWHNGIKDKEHRAINLALTSEASFQVDNIRELDGTPDDITKTDYQRIKSSLIKLVNINKDVRFAYIYTKRDGKIYFLADSEMADSSDYSPPGQEYTEAKQAVFDALDADNPIVTKPTKDRWGNWVSVYVPMKDLTSGKTIAVLGFDYPAAEWNHSATDRTVEACVFVISLFVIFLSFYSISTKNNFLNNERHKLALTYDKLSEQEKIFRTFYEQSPFGVTLGNYEHGIIEANTTFAKMVGRSKEELEGMNWADITHPDDVAKDVELCTSFKKGEINGYSLKKRYLRPDGSFIWVNITIAPLVIENKQNLSHICMVEDLTDQVKAEMELQESERSNAMLLSNLPGMAYRCNYDKHWTMKFVSEGSYLLTGYRPESLIDNHEIAFNDLIVPEYRETLFDKWSDIIEKKNVFSDEYPIITASGEIKWVFERGQGVYDNEDKIIAVEGLIIDITDRRKREEEIKYMYNHDSLTGLFNRRYFDEERNRLDNEKYYPLTIIIGDINGLKFINSTLGHMEGDRLITIMAKILQNSCRDGDILARTGGDEFSILLPNTAYEDAYSVIKRIGILCDEQKELDESYNISISLGYATKMNKEENFGNVIKDAEESMYRHKLLQSKSLHSSIISSMKSSLYEKSQETEEHAQRLIELSRTIGEKMNLMEEQLNELELLSTLHDIGKIGISDGILNKPGKLTPGEWVEMKRHPEMGYRIAMSTPELAPIADYILCHHERWDGTGYPQGLKGEDIPLLSRIIAVADSFDAMTSDRAYRKALPFEEAMEEIRRNAGTQFDPLIAELFLENISNDA